MSTPTSANLSQPSSASKKPTGHVTTPSYLGGLSSPAPRSVPSPAATRKEHAGKTPVNHPTASSQGSKTLGSTPMVQNLSQTSMTVSSSPGGQNAGFGTPSGVTGLGVDLGSATPGQLNMSTPQVGGMSMMPTMSDLGFSASGGKRNEDEERRMKMRKVLKSIGRPKGRISEEAIARLSRRLGFDHSIDDNGRMGDREVAIAGNRVTVVVDLKQQRVQDVNADIVSLGMQPVTDAIIPPMPEPSAPASRIMSRNLAVPSGVLLQSSLDQFAVSLNSLAQMDRISKAGGVNCFEALNGLYKSLKRLHEAERAAAKEEQNISGSDVDLRAEREVLCKRSGKASYDDSSKIGLALQYWTPEPGVGAKNDDIMDIDKQPDTQDSLNCRDEVLCLRIGVEECPASMYPPLRLSDAWLPESSDHLLSGSGIPWQEPPPTYAYAPESANNQTGHMNIDGAQRLPDIRFIATLDPPVIMPYPAILNILSSVGQQPPQVLMPIQYHAMLLDIPIQAVNTGTPIQAKQSVLSFHESQEVRVTHDYTLDVVKAEYGYKLEAVPFSHPRQLVELLPTLRQWAHFGDLVRDALKTNTTLSEVAEVTNDMNGAHIGGEKNGADEHEMSLDDMLVSPRSDFATRVQVGIGLRTSPQPGLTVTYSDSSGANVGNALVQVLPNAEILVCNNDNGNGGQPTDVKKFAKALAVAGDLGVWIEWMRKQG